MNNSFLTTAIIFSLTDGDAHPKQDQLPKMLGTSHQKATHAKDEKPNCHQSMPTKSTLTNPV